jgi:hypothetical protein
MTDDDDMMLKRFDPGEAAPFCKAVDAPRSISPRCHCGKEVFSGDGKRPICEACLKLEADNWKARIPLVP